jgi:hypothetical protein
LIIRYYFPLHMIANYPYSNFLLLSDSSFFMAYYNRWFHIQLSFELDLSFILNTKLKKIIKSK